jgi:3-methyl-2-oxobutanoate hydroxymethyltransferase
MNILELRQYKEQKRRIAMVTCYDFWSAKILNESSVDIILVGDSGAMVMHGHEDTLPATVEMMCTHVSAVKRGAPKKFIVADMPFMSFRSDFATNVRNVRMLMQAGAHAVKLEGYVGNTDFVRHVVDSGVPVMGHIGLTPQSVHGLGGFRVQGRSEEHARKLIEGARELENAGCFSIVLECVPGALAAEITSTLKISTIGIGAGAACDGQVLVLHDLLGLNQGFSPKFLRRYMEGAELIKTALESYCDDVKEGRFPSEAETYENH